MVALSTDKHGSRVVDVLWTHSELGKKEALARVLLTHEEQLTADFYGSIVLRNCNIAEYRRRQEGWLEQQRAAGKKRQLFEDLLGDAQSQSGGSQRKRTLAEEDQTEPQVKKKKKKKKST